MIFIGYSMAWTCMSLIFSPETLYFPRPEGSREIQGRGWKYLGHTGPSHVITYLFHVPIGLFQHVFYPIFNFINSCLCVSQPSKLHYVVILFNNCQKCHFNISCHKTATRDLLWINFTYSKSWNYREDDG